MVSQRTANRSGQIELKVLIKTNIRVWQYDELYDVEYLIEYQQQIFKVPM